MTDKNHAEIMRLQHALKQLDAVAWFAAPAAGVVLVILSLFAAGMNFGGWGLAAALAFYSIGALAGMGLRYRYLHRRLQVEYVDLRITGGAQSGGVSAAIGDVYR